DRLLTAAHAEALGVTYCPTAIDACRGADALTIHLALNEQTRGIIGAQLLEALRPGAYVINTSRGPVVDQDALVTAIQTRGLRAGLDVFAQEPGAGDDHFSDPIGKNPAVYGTHHIGASTDQASEAVGDEVVRIVSTYLQEGEVPNCVNVAQRTAATHMLVVRHRDEVGVLAHVLDLLGQAGINVQEMENVVFSGAAAASARIQVDSAPGAELLASLHQYSAVFAATVVSLDA
ncbi:MAG: hydroxyacid dehydrogenase, partial [Oligoflexia bacterium]|nr:hydroxyacid dehydrogenase [Oligoflexia bacterium]